MDPSWLPPTAVAVPIIGACLVLALGRRAPRVVVDLLALLTAAVMVTVTAALLVATADGRVVTWVGGWTPHQGVSVGIVLVADPLNTAFALLAAVLTFCALLYTWRYFETAEAHVHVLVLLFLTGMVGFALTADLFNLFVFFELMGAAAYALTGHKIEEPRAVHGGFTFGVVNSLGAYFSLTGIGLLYARTGQLGLPQLGAALDGHRPDVLVVAAAVLVLTGLLVKAAVVPFHFWLADAHAVAPSPVCALFSGVMAPLGLYGALRVSTTVFGGVLHLEHAFLVLGVLTAVVGAAMCLTQRHLKRMLAFSTIAHLGLFLVALSTLTVDGVTGSVVYVLGHAGVKAALFLLVGLLLARHGNVDEYDLYGRGTDDGVVRWLFPLGALALAGLPPFGTGLGKAISEEASGIPWLFVFVSALTGAAVLRAALRVHFGLGPPPADSGHETTSGEHEEQEGRFPNRAPLTILAPVLLLGVGGLAVGLIPAVPDLINLGAQRFLDRTGYMAQALHAAPPTPLSAPTAGTWNSSGILLGALSAALAVVIAVVAMYKRLPRLVVLHRAHSGHVGDYVAWLLLGIALLGVLIGLPLMA